MHEFNLFSNGGLTIAALVMFTGTPLDHEKIFQFASNPGNNVFSFLLKRGVGKQLSFEMFEGSARCSLSPLAVIVQDTWQQIVVVYDTNTHALQLRIDSRVFNTSCSGELEGEPPFELFDKVFALSDIGQNLDGRIADLFVVDTALTDDAIAKISSKMRQGQDTLTTCEACPTGTYGLQDNKEGLKSCIACPAGKYQPVAGGILCLNCLPGKYQSQNSSASCDSCGSSVFSPGVASTSDEICLYKYELKVSFSISASPGDISPAFVARFVDEMSTKLGIAKSKITQIDFGMTNSTSRRLLSMTGSFTVESTSKIESDATKSALNLDLLNVVLATASQQKITASSIDVQRRTIIPVATVPPVTAPPSVAQTPSPSEPMPTSILIAIGASVGGIVVIIVVICVCYRRNRANHDSGAPLNVGPAKFDVSDSSYFCQSCSQHPYRIVGNV
jgi:hypothetical protein